MKYGWLALGFLAACGDNAATTPDAAPDAPVDAAPDALQCGSPSTACGTACVEVESDEANCGACGVVCKGGEVCSGTCTCPVPFVPATIEPGPFDRFQSAGAITVAIGPIIDNGVIHPLLIGSTATTPIDTDIDLSVVPLGEPPFVAAGYGFALQTMAVDAAYTVTAGTLRLSVRCATEVQGTLTNATFQGVTGGLMSPQVDPLGCTFTVPTLAFHVMTAACP